jgi:uncharacterized protein YbaR (Trm112 family)
MIHKVPCPNCKGTLYEIDEFDDPQRAAGKPSARSPLILAGDRLICPHCGKKLRTLPTVGPYGFPLLTVAESE